ncbi:inositol monophosphatase family protein [Streptomyces umbrinus]|uniref:inositol monophosphatase family protein n=1 Tax=Streptomyces umbrinus TaxID=67370 RepID=UPI003C2F13A7
MQQPPGWVWQTKIWASATDIQRDMIDSYADFDDAEVAIAAARAGADVVRNLYGQRLARTDKGSGDFATAADVDAKAMILSVIHAARPDDGVLGEEGGQRGAAGAAVADPVQWRGLLHRW